MSMPFYREYYHLRPPSMVEHPSVVEKDRLLKTIDMIPEDVRTILDVGCGEGMITKHLSEFQSVVGVDITERALEELSCPAVVADAGALPFPDASVDMVLATEILEHLPSSAYRTTLDELQRISAKYILISVPNDEFLQERFTKCPAAGARSTFTGICVPST